MSTVYAYRFVFYFIYFYFICLIFLSHKRISCNGRSAAMGSRFKVGPAKWEALLEGLRNMTSENSSKKQLELNHVCKCCFQTKQELADEKYPHWHPKAYRSIWNYQCRSLNLMKVIGRDYLIPEHQG